MSLNTNTYSEGGGGNDLGQARPGPHPATLIGVVDVGVQDGGAWKGKDKPPCQQILMIFSLADDFVELEGVPKQRLFTTKVNAKTGERAKLTKIQAALDPNNETQGDLIALIGRPCTLNLEAGKNEETKETFVKFGGIFAHMAGTAVPVIGNETIVFDTENPDVAIYDKLHGWMQELLKKGLNYSGSQLEQIINAHEAVQQQQAANTPQPAAQVAPQPQVQTAAPQTGNTLPTAQAPTLPAAPAASPAAQAAPVCPPGWKFDPATGHMVPA